MVVAIKEMFGDGWLIWSERAPFGFAISPASGGNPAARASPAFASLRVPLLFAKGTGVVFCVGFGFRSA